MHLILVLLFVLGMPMPAKAGQARVIAVSAADEIVLMDGRKLKLEGMAPPFGHASFPWQEKAKSQLESLIGSGLVEYNQPSTDRYGRLVAQVYVTDETGRRIWLQQAMLQAGLAFVYPPASKKITETVAIEAQARRSERGIWADAAYRDIPAGSADLAYGRYAFVSGKVADAVRVKDRVYVNFGQDWRSDFTVAVAARDLRAFRKMKLDPLELKGKTIRVRGWIKRNYGPMIAVNDPAQIEILD